MSFSISRIVAGDLPALRDLAEHTFRVAWQRGPSTLEFDAYCARAFSAEQLRTELEDTQSEFYFVRCEGEPIAYLKLNIDRRPPGVTAGRYVQIERIYVRADHQGRRIGEQLLGLATERARATDARALWLSVWKEAPRSVAFYERNGFRISGTTGFPLGGDPESDWIMECRVG